MGHDLMLNWIVFGLCILNIFAWAMNKNWMAVLAWCVAALGWL